jgi:hypothetical protein
MVCVGGLSRVRFSASYEMNVGIMYGTYLLQAVFRVGLGCSVCVCVCVFKHVCASNMCFAYVQAILSACSIFLGCKDAVCATKLPA